MAKDFLISELDPDLIEPNSDTYMDERSTGSKVCVIGKPGTGKCLHGDTPVMMYNATLKLAKNVKDGDEIMGDDGTIRVVSGTTTGQQPMYMITQSNSFPYIVNKSHILSLYHIKLGKIVDIEITKYLSLSQDQRNLLKGYRVDIQFPDKPISFDPYIGGYWFGLENGSIEKSGKMFSEAHPLVDVTRIHEIRKGLNDKFNPFLYSQYDIQQIHNNQRIPGKIMFNSMAVREQFFRGVLDACGWSARGGSECLNSQLVQWKGHTLFSYDIDDSDISREGYEEGQLPVTKHYFSFSNKNFTNDFEFICKSLGGTCFRSEHGLILADDPNIETVQYKGTNFQNSKQRLFLSTVHVRLLGHGSYYGFELTGNRRFLLGDLTVTHNTTLVSSLLYQKRDIFPCGEVFSGTEDSHHHYKTMFPSTFVHNKLNLDSLGSYIKRQKIASKYLPNPWSVCLLDDCTDDPAVLRKPIFHNIFKNGRHWKMLFILSLQYSMDILPAIRTNIDGTFILRESNKRNKKVLFENYAGVFGNEKDFNGVLDAITEDYTALYIHNKTTSNNLEDCVYYYKGEIPPNDFKFGSPSFWDFHYERYNPSYTDPIIC